MVKCYLKDILREHNLTLTSVAMLTGIYVPRLSDFASERKTPSLPIAMLIFKALRNLEIDVHFEDIFYYEDQE